MENSSRRYLFTSEQVNCGHPDKLCDFVSDSMLDAALTLDPRARVAIETSAKNNAIMVFGEITCKGELNAERVVREAIKYIGYDSQDKGMDYKNAMVIVNVDKQVDEISVAVGKHDEENIGAGDQGIMFGYATDEHDTLMPSSYVYATELLRKFDELRRSGELAWARPDAKSQVTLEYDESSKGLKVVGVHTVLMSVQHTPDVTLAQVQQDLKDKVISAVFPAELLTDQVKYFLNPSGSFIMGGPMADAGLTGRKIIADTYGGWGSHGGGCFSGKDGSKVDRSGAYAARWIAKSLVSAKLCHRCIVQLSYGIGIPEPISVFVNSFGTGKEFGYTDNQLDDIIKNNFDLRAGALRKTLQLDRPVFRETTLFGHFLKSGSQFTWENPKDLNTS